MIELQNVTKTYGKKKNTFTALDDVSISVPDGLAVAIIGKSGSGKSTLMHIMSGLDHPTSGSVSIDGTTISAMKPKAVDNFRSKKVGFIFQSFFVQANESCYFNVSLPLEISRLSGKVRREHIKEALNQVDLSEKINQKARNLSGGQKQRLAIARAIVTKPTILFADEPTGNLDSVTGAKIEELLFNFNRTRGATLIIVTHDADLAARCDMQIHIKDGRIDHINNKVIMSKAKNIASVTDGTLPKKKMEEA
jgi:putative ABC transport system ATP-binding protein